jgi:hypothetical protein
MIFFWRQHRPVPSLQLLVVDVPSVQASDFGLTIVSGVPLTNALLLMLE